MCVSLRKKSTKNHPSKITEKGIISNKDFWYFVKPFLTNTSFIDSTDITLKLDNEIITEKTKLVESFSNHYVNIVETALV